MMPKLIALARRRIAGSMPSIGTPNISDAVMAWMSRPSAKAWRSVRRCRPYGRAREARSGCSRPRSAACPSSATKAVRMARPSLGAHRDVLQIRLERRQPARGGGGERVGGVHAARSRDGCRWAARRCRCDFSLASRRQSSTLRGRSWPSAASSSSALGVRAPGAGLGAPSAGQAHLVEQDLAELLRRADVEVLAGKLADLVFEPARGSGRSCPKAARASRARP